VKSISEQVEVEIRKWPAVNEFVSQMPFTATSKRVLEFAIDEARGFDHNYVGSEHLLLGLVRQPKWSGAEIFAQHKLTIDSLRKEVGDFLGAHRKEMASQLRVPGYSLSPRTGPKDEAQNSLLFDDSLHDAMAAAHDVALEANHDHIDCEHLLMGVCGLKGFSMLQIFDPAPVQKAVGDIMTKNASPEDPLAYTRNAKLAVQFAIEESIAAEDAKVGIRHLLIGIARVSDSNAAKILSKFSITPDNLRGYRGKGEG
jgi:ATP-dependent Clp protease ATP-binding subunit ClpA